MITYSHLGYHRRANKTLVDRLNLSHRLIKYAISISIPALWLTAATFPLTCKIFVIWCFHTQTSASWKQCDLETTDFSGYRPDSKIRYMCAIVALGVGDASPWSIFVSVDAQNSISYGSVNSSPFSCSTLNRFGRNRLRTRTRPSVVDRKFMRTSSSADVML